MVQRLALDTLNVTIRVQISVGALLVYRCIMHATTSILIFQSEDVQYARSIAGSATAIWRSGVARKAHNLKVPRSKLGIATFDTHALHPV